MAFKTCLWHQEELWSHGLQGASPVPCGLPLQEHSWSLPTNIDHENVLEFYSASSSPLSTLCEDHCRLPRTALLVRAACPGLVMPLEDLE